MIQAAVQVLITMYETLEMSVEEIAADQELDVLAVKVALASNSKKYRDDCGIMNNQVIAAEIGSEGGEVKKGMEIRSELGYTKDELLAVKQVIYDIATKEQSLTSTKLDAAKFVFNEYHGRNDPKKGADIAMTQNIFMMQKALQSAKHTLSKVRDAVPVEREVLSVG